MLLDVVHHVDNADVGAAVAESLQGAECCSNGRVGVRAGGGYDVGRERGVVTTAVLCVDDEGGVQNLGLQGAEVSVQTQHVENVFRRGVVVLGRMDEERVSVVVVFVGLIAVDRQLREQGYELKALPEDIVHGGVVRVTVVGVEREDAAGQGVHHVLAGGFHDDVPDEVNREGAVAGQQVLELLELLFVRELAEQEQVDDLFVAVVAAVRRSGDDFLDVISAVAQNALALDALAVHFLVTPDFRELGEAGQDALAVGVTETAFYVIFCIERRVNGAVLNGELGKLGNLWTDNGKVSVKFQIVFSPLPEGNIKTGNEKMVFSFFRISREI